MRILITGGTGLIGRALSRSLVADGHEVVALTRSPAQAQAGAVPGVQSAGWDGRTAAGWGHLADGAHAIVNLAGENIGGGRWNDARKQRILSSRTDAGAAVLDALRQVSAPPPVLIQASAVGYYGPREDDAQVTESAPQGSDWLANVVGQWERSTEGAAALGVRRVLARTGLVFSAEGGSFPRMKLPFDLVLAGGWIGSGRQYLPWIHIEDQVRALRFLIDSEQAEGPFNLCAPNAVTYREFAQVMGKVLGRPARMPAPAFAVQAAFGEMAQLLLTGQRQVPARLLQMGFTFRYPDLEPALRNLLRKESSARLPA